MASIHGNMLARWRARRHALTTGLRAGHATGLDLVDMDVFVREYRREQRELSVYLTPSRRIRMSSFILNSFSSQQSLSLFRFLPNDIGQHAQLLHVVVHVLSTSLSVHAVERLCIVFQVV